MVASALEHRRQAYRELVAETEEPGRSEEPIPANERDLVYFHVMSRSHLRKKYLEKARPKEILANLCQHYARVFQIALLDYCIMDNHVHLIVGIERQALHLLGKFVGCIKQQFTREFKAWFNGSFRPSDRYREPKLERGTLWDGPYVALELDDYSYMGACTLYVENNRVVATWDEERQEDTSLAAEPTTEELIPRLEESRFQSAGWYLRGRQGHDPVLTDGTDGVWATPEEVEEYWTRPKRELPAGWRKVWCQDRRGILKPPADQDRRYASHPYIESLGDTPQEQARQFAINLQMAFRRTREPKNHLAS